MLDAPAAIKAFDLLDALGEDHRGLPLVVSRSVLLRLLSKSRRIVLVAYVDRSGSEMYAQAMALDHDGIVA